MRFNVVTYDLGSRTIAIPEYKRPYGYTAVTRHPKTSINTDKIKQILDKGAKW